MSFQTKAPIVDWSTRLAFLDIKNMGLYVIRNIQTKLEAIWEPKSTEKTTFKDTWQRILPRETSDSSE